MGLAALLLAAAAPAGADIFPVSNANDTGAGSLRDAIEMANATGGADLITFVLPADSVIEPAMPLPAITETLAIDGSAAMNLTIGSGGSLLAVNAGMLTLNQVGLEGDVSVAAGAELIYIVAGTVPFDGNLAGDGDFQKNGPGTLTLSGASSLTGATSVNAGSLVFQDSVPAGDATVAAGASLVYDLAMDAAYAGTLDGDGAFEKRGDGTLTLDGAHPILGTTTVSGGRLDLVGAGDLDGMVDIGPGATLGGDGESGPLTSNGTVAPGAPIGALFVDGDATLAPGSVLEIEFDGPMSGDQLVVNGNATIDGAVLELVLLPGVDTVMSQPVLTTTGMIIGAFDTTSLDLAFLDLDVDPQMNQVLVSLLPSGATYSDFATTPNQAAAAGVLDAALPGAMGDLDDVFDTFRSTLRDADVAPLLDALSGEQITGFTTPWLRARSRFQRAIDARVGGFVSGAPFAVASTPPRPVQLAAVGPAVTAPIGGETGPGGWLDGYAVFGDVDGGGGAADLEYRVYGGAAGIDYRPTEHLLFGGAVGYARLAPDLDDRRGTGHADTLQGSLYGAYTLWRLHVAAAVGGGYGFFDSERRIETEALSRKATGDFDGWEVSTHVEAGANVLELGGVRFEPLARFDWTHLERDSFGESGASSLDLLVDDEQIDSLVSGVGMRITGTFELGEGAQLTPELRARWSHEFGDVDRDLDARLAGDPGAGALRVSGAEIGRDALVAGAGYAVSLAPGLHLYADYDVLWNSDVLEHAARGGLQLVW